MKTSLVLLLVASLSSCVGISESDDNFTVHAESFNLLGLQIPGSAHDAAWAEVPEGAEVTTVRSTPQDLTSAAGVWSRMLGISHTEISGKK